MIDLAQLLSKLVTASDGNAELTETAVRLAWTRVAGEGLRQQVVPFRVYRKTLIVAVADVIWQRQLHYMSAEFVSRINRLLGREVISSIEFRIDPVISNQNRSSSGRTEQNRTPRAIPAEIISAADSIRDLDLRQRFIRAAENCVTRRDLQRQNSA
jgi:hypothetical protein